MLDSKSNKKNTGKPLIFSFALLARSNTLISFSRQIRETQDVLSQCSSSGLCLYPHLWMTKSGCYTFTLIFGVRYAKYLNTCFFVPGSGRNTEFWCEVQQSKKAGRKTQIQYLWFWPQQKKGHPATPAIPGRRRERQSTAASLKEAVNSIWVSEWAGEGWSAVRTLSCGQSLGGKRKRKTKKSR